jgi:hypothetical protein
MTKKRYAKNTDLSRSRTRGDKGAFETLQPPSEPHPVDVTVDRIPSIAAGAKRLIRQSDRFKRQVGSPAAFVAYEDLRLSIQSKREVAYYNIGHEHGLLLGRSQAFASRPGQTAASRSFRRAVLSATKLADLRPEQLAAVLLELAHACVLGVRPRRRRTP